MTWFKRILLFAVTNLAVILVLTVVLRVLGIDRLLAQQGGLDYRALLALALVLGMGGSLVSLALSRWMATRLTGAEVLERPRSETESWLLSSVADLARQKGVGTPDVAIYDAPDMNAFATGVSRDRALVAVSTGLLRGMDREQVRAVLGHELSHVANGDMVTLALIQGVVNTFVLFFSRVVGYLVDRAVFRTERGVGPGYFITVIVTEIVFGLLATMVVMWFSRWREFRADAGSAAVVGAASMISALERLGQGAEPAALPNQLSAFGIAGRRGGGLQSLFLSHPPLATRIKALRRLR
ncbi:MAG TPA: protease HtpX [Gammaproteobacteria bacterium]|nr:protease HtpX [Gammaproteobacteria bacterium]